MNKPDDEAERHAPFLADDVRTRQRYVSPEERQTIALERFVSAFEHFVDILEKQVNHD